MDKSVQKYEPMMMVTLKNGRVLLYPQSKDEIIQKGIDSTQVFLRIEGIRVNKWEISIIEPMPKEYDILIGQPENVRALALASFAQYKQNLGKEPTREVKQKKLERILKEVFPDSEVVDS